MKILASLRAIPNMLVLRPTDAVEAAECWDIAFGTKADAITAEAQRNTRTPWYRLLLPGSSAAWLTLAWLNWLGRPD